MHNDCWHALPNDAKQVKNIDGYKAYQFTDPKDGKVVTVVQKDLNRFETPNHQAGYIHILTVCLSKLMPKRDAIYRQIIR